MWRAAWNTKIMPVKVLNAEGLGTDADIAQGIVWATDHGAGVVNLSLGGPWQAVIDSAVDYALQHEVGRGGGRKCQLPALFYLRVRRVCWASPPPTRPAGSHGSPTTGPGTSCPPPA